MHQNTALEANENGANQCGVVDSACVADGPLMYGRGVAALKAATDGTNSTRRESVTAAAQEAIEIRAADLDESPFDR